MPLLAAGLGIANWHARLFKRVDTNIMTFDEPDKLVQDGLFRYSRNPMYLGFTIAMTGIAVLLGSLSPVIVLVMWIAVTQFWYIPFEENMMLRLQNEIYAERSVNVRIRAGLNMTRTNLTSSRSFRRPLGDRHHRLKL